MKTMVLDDRLSYFKPKVLEACLRLKKINDTKEGQRIAENIYK